MSGQPPDWQKQPSNIVDQQEKVFLRARHLENPLDGAREDELSDGKPVQGTVSTARTGHVVTKVWD